MDDSLTEEEMVEVMESAPGNRTLWLKPETFKDLFTDKRLEIVEKLKEEEFESIRDLSNTLDREPSAVQKDLKQLFEHSIVDFKKESTRKIPGLRPDAILVEPILAKGE
jgi:predicted transcriptional regulator